MTKNTMFVSVCLSSVLMCVSTVVGNELRDICPDENGCPPTAGKKIWLSQMFDEAKRTFDIDLPGNSDCRRDFDLYRMHLQNQSIWAIRMMESSEWPSVGIFAGMTDHMGNWAECMLVSAHQIRGQYCLAQVSYDFATNRNLTKVDEFPAEDSSAWTAIEMYSQNPVRVNRRSLRWALCIPSSCRSEELEFGLNKSVRPVFEKYGFGARFRVEDALCSTQEASKMTQNFHLIKVVVACLLTLLVGSTIYDVVEDDKETLVSEFLTSFSVARNARNLVRVRTNDHPPLSCLKLVAMIFIVYGHVFIYVFGYPKFNTELVEIEYSKLSILMSRSAIVDLFISLGGFLTFYHGFESAKRGGCLYLFFSVVIRWLRIIPAFGILTLIIIHILPFLGEGPLWNQRVLLEAENCRQTWWTSFLALTNFILPEKQCLLVSWYLAVDIQLTLLGSVLLYIITKNQKVGAVMVFLTFVTGQVITFSVVYTNKYYGLHRGFISFLEDPRSNEEFTRFYIATYTRIAPYLVGFATAFLVSALTKSNYKFSKTQSRFVLLTLFLVSECSQWYGVTFFQFGRQYDRIENSIYAAVNRWLFVLAYNFLGLQYFTSGLDKFLDKLFNRKIYVPFGRLTFSVFLINCVVQLYISASQAALMPTSTSVNMYVWLPGILILTYAAGYFFHIFVEAPFVNISKLLQRILFKVLVNSETYTANPVAPSLQEGRCYQKGENIIVDRC